MPEGLKEQVACVAERTGTTSHALIPGAIVERVDERERRNDFYETAERRYAEIVATGATIPWEQMRTYLEDRTAGKRASRPSPRKLTR